MTEAEENILRAERDGAIARLAAAEKEIEHWQARAIAAEGLFTDYGSIRILLRDMRRDLKKMLK